MPERIRSASKFPEAFAVVVLSSSFPRVFPVFVAVSAQAVTRQVECAVEQPAAAAAARYG